MKSLFCLLFVILLTGCAANSIRVIGLDSEGQWIPFVTAKMGGCLVEVNGSKAAMEGVSIDYHDAKNNCTVTVKR